LQLAQILKIHDRATHLSPHALSDALGDGFLLKNNELYLNLRRALLRHGYRFTSQRFEDHHSFPLAVLQTMLEKKRIPYINNVSVLKKLSQRNRTLSIDLRFPLFNTNHILHESAHAHARATTNSFYKMQVDTNLKHEKLSAFNLLYEESFANACDMMAWAGVSGTMENFFLSCNSYADNPQFFGRIKWTDAKKTFYFGLIFLSYIHSNFLYEKMSKKEFLRVYSFTKAALEETYKPRSSELERLYLIFNSGLKLSLQFRLVTTKFYFQMLGLRSDIDRLLEFDFMSLLENDGNYRKSFQELCGIIRPT
jgi:hypothetical protein